MLMLGLTKTIDQLAMDNSVCWYCHVSIKGCGQVLRRAWNIEIKAQRRRGRTVIRWEKQLGEERLTDCDYERGGSNLLIKVICLH